MHSDFRRPVFSRMRLNVNLRVRMKVIVSISLLHFTVPI